MKLNTPEKEIGEMMRMVIAHEIGHGNCSLILLNKKNGDCNYN